MLSRRKWAHLLPVEQDFTIPARFILRAGKWLLASPLKVTKRHDDRGDAGHKRGRALHGNVDLGGVAAKDDAFLGR